MTLTRRSKAQSTSDPPARRPGPPGGAGFQAHGWTIFFHPALTVQLEKLLAAVEAERERKSGSPSAAAKLLRSAMDLIFDEIPRDPARPEFRLGKTLGDARKHWFRVKFGGARFRLFFRFRTDVRIIVFAWMNDEDTLRTYGSRTDAYAVFGRMLDGGNPPDSWDGLFAAATTDEALLRASRLASKLGATGQ